MSATPTDGTIILQALLTEADIKTKASGSGLGQPLANAGADETIWLINDTTSGISDVNIVMGDHGDYVNGPIRDKVPAPLVQTETLPKGTPLKPSDIVTPDGNLLRQNGLMMSANLYALASSNPFRGIYAAISFKLDAHNDAQVDVGIGISSSKSDYVILMDQSTGTQAMASKMNDQDWTNQSMILGNSNWKVSVYVHGGPSYANIIIVAT